MRHLDRHRGGGTRSGCRHRVDRGRIARYEGPRDQAREDCQRRIDPALRGDLEAREGWLRVRGAAHRPGRIGRKKGQGMARRPNAGRPFQGYRRRTCGPIPSHDRQDRPAREDGRGSEGSLLARFMRSRGSCGGGRHRQGPAGLRVPRKVAGRVPGDGRPEGALLARDAHHPLCGIQGHAGGLAGHPHGVRR